MMKALECEHNVQRIITQQEINGVVFNKARARFYIYVLREKQIRLYRKIRPFLSSEYTLPNKGIPVSKPFLKSGGYTAQVCKWYEDPSVVSGQFTRVEFVEPDLGSRAKLIAQLLRLGWHPQNFTIKGNPRLTVDGEPCPSLLQIDSEVGSWIASWYIYSHRESQIAGWLRKLRPDGKLTASGITIGTPTYRFRHSIVVNVPKAASYVPFGWQMRSLFTVPRGRRLVGHDASGLELRMLAHYINDDDFSKEVVDGDIHTKNQVAAGLPTRDAAKTFIYAFNYGAGDVKIGRIVGGGRKEGKRIKSEFLANNPKLATLIEQAQRAAGRGYLVGLDGRKIRMRRDKDSGQVQVRKALNTLLQAAGATVMKYSMIMLDEWDRIEGLDAKKVIDMHDEGQTDVAKDDAERHAELAADSVRAAGEYLQLNVPLAGEAKIGLNWAQTH